jgi:hypothetical protein
MTACGVAAGGTREGAASFPQPVTFLVGHNLSVVILGLDPRIY